MQEQDVLIPIPQSLEVEPARQASIEPRACTTYCERIQCQNTCQRLCQNCLGTACQSSCQTSGEGGCSSGCQSVCQNCLGDVCQSSCQSGCQSAEGCTTTCENVCQNCQGVPCQTCQDCQSTCERGCQSACESSSQNPTSYGSISIGEVTSDSISLTLSSIPSATSYVIAYRPASVTTADTVETTSRSYTLIGLSPNTRYAINYYGKNSYGTGPYMPSPVYATTEPEILVDPWSWTASNGAATATQTRNAYAILQGTRAADDFHHNVWNDLVDKVVEMREALGYSWTTDSGRFPSASGCKVSAGDTLSALKYNALKTNIGSIKSTGIQDVDAGDEITGYHIVHLTDVLNEIIEG